MKRRDELDASFEEFVASSSRRLLHSAELLTGRQQDAEDVVQAVLLKMYSRWGRIRLDDPGAYARRAVVNELTDRWRRSRGREVTHETVPERAEQDSAIDAVHARHAALDLLSGLTERERAVVVLRYYEDLSEAQTGELLGVAVGTVKSTASRALSKLRAGCEPGASPLRSRT